ncbi:hypothetical protein KR100_11320 [Synechococcus sp. KORDI-100]|nr:hypothetical protein KR100_11320 [Synechococcus sp. KORDI-100]
MTANHHQLLDIHSIEEQFAHRSAIAIHGDPSKINSLAHNDQSESISRCNSTILIGRVATTIRSINAGQTNPLT